VAYTSFESSSDNEGWNYNMTDVADNGSYPYVTGKKHYQSNIPLVTSKSFQSGEYILSFVKKEITQGAPYMRLQGSDGFMLLDTKTIPLNNEWEYWEFSFEVNWGSSIITVDKYGADFFIDDIRLRPMNSIMKTWHYKQSIGILSETDNNHKTTFYEYDGFGRLKLIKDQDGNLVKRFQYKYMNQ